MPEPSTTSAPRQAKTNRRTLETAIELELTLDGTGRFEGTTGVAFFDHMLNLLIRHAGFDLRLEAKGDTEIDAHHTVEDVGIVLGQALLAALGDRAGIRRYGSAHVPMEESLARATLDLCNRPYFLFAGDVPKAKVGEFDAELGEEFFRAFFVNARITAHLDLLRGGNVHHMLEACFKATGLALKDACGGDPAVRGVLSTKGVL